MNVKGKVRAALVTTLALTLALAACSSSSNTSAQPGASCAPDQDVSTVANGKLTVGVPTFMPFVKLGSNGSPTGIDGDIINDIAKEMCLTVTGVPLDYTGLIPAVQQNRIDLAIGSIYRSEARAKVAGVTAPIYTDPMGVISKSGINTVEQMQGLRVGTINGNAWVEDLRKTLTSPIKLYPSSNELKQDLLSGRLDVAIDSFGAASVNYKDAGYEVKIMAKDSRIGASTAPPQTGFYFSKSNVKLGDVIDKHIQEMKSRGQIAEFLKKWGLDPGIANTGSSRLVP